MFIVRSLRQVALAVLLSISCLLGLGGAVVQDVTATATSPAAALIGSVRWTTTTVNVRGHPTTATRALFVLAAGVPVRIVRVATDPARRTWYLVRVQGRPGWLAGWLTSTTRPRGATSAAPVSALGPVRWTTASVNVRGHPVTLSKPLFVLPARTAVRVVRSTTDAARRTWHLVQVHGRLGWVAAWLTSGARSGSATSPAGTTSSGTTTTGWTTARASDYGIGDGLLGDPLACGGRLTTTVMVVAHKTLPCGTRILIRSGGVVVAAVVLDRGPYVAGLTFDLGPAVCHALHCGGVFDIEWKLAD